MKILIAVQGNYGRRIAAHIAQNAPSGWSLATIALPARLPLLIDEPEDFLPTDIPETDLLLALSESEGAAQLVPAIARRSHAR
ncbi:MAG: DUF166 family protein, partial [Chloroflexota bacterium]